MEPKSNSFLWGVATSGYQSEGGYNQPGQPQNNWAEIEQQGKVMRTGAAAEFWSRYDEDFRQCEAMGLNAFRMGWEWARIQPSSSSSATPAPEFDFTALDAYADRIAACRSRGLEPVVTLHHFTHPAWLGNDIWLSEATLEMFIEYVRTSVLHVNRRLCDRHHQPPVGWYITINEPNVLIPNTHLNGQFPGGTLGTEATLQAYDLVLAAHVRAYHCIREIYEAEGWHPPQISLNTYCSDLYWLDKAIWDLLDLGEKGIKAKEFRDYAEESAKELEAALRAANLPFRRDIPYQIGRFVRWLAHGFGRRAFDGKHFTRYLSEVERSRYPQVFDYVAIDYYDPFLAHSFRLPLFSDFEFEVKDFRGWLMSGITSKWWDWRTLPEGLHFFCSYYAKAFRDRAILIAENGMALRRKPDNSIAAHRRDRIRRSEFLKAHIEQIQRLLREGVPLAGYMHWSLTDNYEWGSYTPRFGLFSIDFAAGTDRIAEDHLGDRPAETYARLLRETRAEGLCQ
ncbi:family 1 glycosylhydrolase [Oscillatoria sp. FACHB-1406]|uniref:family 1 glycosylhydrolase n=1 Tax=Oscillatoria sp. FACHB-1406 TaxID=2692846 RepID=UPI00168546CF|nr:family 1 glycosylhydrolase [Oscillatoria sp. FACHB-1406]MBD2576894.1 glycoside hydrolase family 1 protein [Oscillatoria sp. FACHB-1406]